MNRLRQFCQERLIVRFDAAKHSLVGARLRQELEIIQIHEQVDAFETAIESIQLLRDQGICCRLNGAGCSSLISYLLNFSEFDPTEYGLPAERFLKANSNGTFQFRFDAHPQSRKSEDDLTTTLKEVSCDSVNIQKSTPLSTIPDLVADEIRRTNSDFEMSSIPWNDEVTFELLWSGRAEGISQLEGVEIPRALADLRPCTLTDIAEFTAMQLQEAHEMGILSEYIHCGHYHDSRNSEHLLVNEILQETRGMILFQEQIMLIMNRVADIPLADAYSFIKAVCQRKWEQVATIREWFSAQAILNGIEEPDVLTLFEKLRTAATRASCKSHHLSQAVTTYRAAYLKAHFPREFSRTLQTIQC